jgi:hypothetical protein
MHNERWYLTAAGATMLAVFIMYLLAFYGVMDWSGRSFILLSDLAPVIAVLFGLIAVAYSLSKLPAGDILRVFWVLILVSLALDLVAESSWFAYDAVNLTEVPYPSIADVFWLLAYVPLFIALVGAMIEYRRLGLSLDLRRSWWVIPLALLIIGGAALIVAPIISSTEASTAEKLVNPAYAFMDLLIVVPAVIFVITLGRGLAARPWLILCFAFIAMGLADMTYIWLSWSGLYDGANMIDLFWVAGYLLIGLAALRLVHGGRALEQRLRSA